jgi:hypothetical protein
MSRRRRHRRRRNPLAVRGVNPISSGEEKLLAVLGVGALGVGAWWFFTQRNTLTIAPGNQSLKVPSGSGFTLKLPAGAQWISIAAGSPTAMPTAVVASGSAPMKMPTSSPGEIVAVGWKDSTGAVQGSMISITS